MAQIKFSSIVNEITGSIGGLTIQKNRYGFTAKQKPTMPFPDSELQRFAARNLAQISNLWGKLSEIQRNSWTTYCNAIPQFPKNGSTTPLTPYEVFQAANLLVQYYGYEPLRECENITTVIANPTVALQLSAGKLRLTLGNFDPWSLLRMPIAMSKPLQGGYTNANYKLRHISVFNIPTSSVDITDLYLSKFVELPAVGQQIKVVMKYFQETIPYIAPVNTYYVTVTG